VTALKLYCATSNQGKLREFRQAAGEDIEIQGLPKVPCPETGRTFEENAVRKAICYSRSDAELPADALVFADDSGLAVDALRGEPGIHSARFAGPVADDLANNLLLLDQLSDVPPRARTARFICCIALTRTGRLIRTFQGEAWGRILEEQRGEKGFGYDPLFYLPELDRTFAELDPQQKGLHSHRGRAFRQLLAWLRETEEGKSAAGLY